ncbi:MAG: hypothetical protein KKI09_04195 [Spirochaetes bacterium]|nr:hypothetical protein [Spirochaetota bacterium]MBU0954610.1 hypothetical protein [Spirochaetota bacterium]
MVQFYLLSVVLNLVAGYALFLADREPKGNKFDGLFELLKDPVLRLVLGVLGSTVGFLKLLTVMRGDIPVVGDLLPALVGLFAGFTLLLEFYRQNTTITTDLMEKLDRVFISNRRVVGLVSMLTALAHFLFPSVLLL